MDLFADEWPLVLCSCICPPHQQPERPRGTHLRLLLNQHFSQAGFTILAAAYQSDLLDVKIHFPLRHLSTCTVHLVFVVIPGGMVSVT